MATRDIYETIFDEDVQTESNANQCPECDGRVTTNAVETVCEDCGMVIDEQRIDHGPEWRAYDDEEAVPACFDSTTTWNPHVDEKLRRDLPDGSARVKILGAPGAYKVDWWSPEPGEDWEPVERSGFDDVEEPDEI